MKPEVPPLDGTRRYAVFLSYRHADNKEPGRQWATWLHQMLENYEIPSDLVGTTNSTGGVIPASLYPVFRDEEELPADADLTRNIRQALENSALLVVICSPRAVQSRFVAEEIRYFKELGNADRILALMIDGEPNASEDAAKQTAGLTAEMECLPEPLRRGVARNDGSLDWSARTEPIAADARPGGRPVQGWTNSAAYREQLLRDGQIEKSKLDSEIKSYEERLELTKLKLVAGALGLPLGVLTQRDKAMQLERARKRARTLRRWLAAVALLAVLSVAGGILAWKKQREAEQARVAEAKQRTLAQEQSEQRRRLLAEAARSDRLIAEDMLGRGESPAAFAYLARSILYDSTSTFAAEKATAALNTWNFPTPVALCKSEKDSYINGAEFSPDSQRIVSPSSNSSARVWEAQTGNVLVTLQGSEGGTLDAQYSPDGQRVVGACIDKTARVWDAKTGRLLATLQGHEGRVFTAQFSRDGQRVVTASEDKTARVWESQSGKLMVTLQGHENAVQTAQFSPDGKLVVTSDDTTARLWDARSGKLLTALPGQSKPAFSQDGHLIVTASNDDTARVWKVQSGKLLATLEGHKDGVISAEFSSDGQRIVTASDKAVRVWEAQGASLQAILHGQAWEGAGVKAKLIAVLPEQERAKFSPDGELIVTAGGKFAVDRSARLWEARSGKLVAILQGHTSWLFSVRFSQDGRRIVTVDNDTARVWEVENSSLGTVLEGHSDQVYDAQFSPDGKRIITASNDTTARVWDTQTGELLTTLESQTEDALQEEITKFSPDGQHILTAVDKIAQLWEVLTRLPPDPEADLDASLVKILRDAGAQSGKLVATLQGHEGYVDSTQFSPDGQRILTASADKTARVWETQSGKLMVMLQGHEAKVWSAQFSPDGQRIVTASEDKTARVWDAQSAKLLATLQGHQAAVLSAEFSPDAHRIVTASNDRTARVWDAHSGKLLTILKGGKYLQSGRFTSDGQRIVTAVPPQVWDAQTGKLLATVDGGSADFSPDGQRILTDVDKIAQVCDAQNGKVVATLRGHEEQVLSAKFSADGQRAVTASTDKKARVWTILPASANAPPPWFRDFLHYMAQQRLNSNGELELVPPNDWLALRNHLRQVVRETAAQDTPYLRILRRFVHE
jgi:WD40 repeat protein